VEELVDDELAILAATRLATLVERFAPGLLIGLHLVGSVADGDFQTGRSDLDFVAVLAHPAYGDELEALSLVHRSYAADGTLPLLDGIWITEADLSAGPDAVREGPTTHDNRFAFIGHGNRNPVTWTTLRRARSIVGALDATSLWADAGRLKAWTRQNVEDYWARWLAAAQKPLSPLGLRALRGSLAAWGVLGLSRMLYTLRTGEVTSKTVAGEWVLGMVGPHWQGIVAEARRIRRTGRGRMSPIRRRRDSLAFMAMLLEMIRSETQPASE